MCCSPGGWGSPRYPQRSPRAGAGAPPVGVRSPGAAPRGKPERPARTGKAASWADLSASRLLSAGDCGLSGAAASSGDAPAWLVAEAGITRICQDPLDLTLQAARFQTQRPLERLGLKSPGYLVGVRRVGPLHWVAQQHQQLYAGQVAADPLGGQRVEHVVRA